MIEYSVGVPSFNMRWTPNILYVKDYSNLDGEMYGNDNSNWQLCQCDIGDNYLVIALWSIVLYCIYYWSYHTYVALEVRVVQTGDNLKTHN